MEMRKLKLVFFYFRLFFEVCKPWTPLSHKMQLYVMQSQGTTAALFSLVSFILTASQTAFHKAQQLLAVHREDPEKNLFQMPCVSLV